MVEISNKKKEFHSMSTISIGTYIDKKRLVFINKKAPKVRARKENTRGLAAQVISSSDWEKLPGDTTTRSFFFLRKKERKSAW